MPRPAHPHCLVGLSKRENSLTLWAAPVGSPSSSCYFPSFKKAFASNICPLSTAEKGAPVREQETDEWSCLASSAWGCKANVGHQDHQVAVDTPWSARSLKPRKICLAVCEICHLLSICFLSKFAAMSENIKLLPRAKSPGPLVKFPSQHGLNLHFSMRSLGF